MRNYKEISTINSKWILRYVKRGKVGKRVVGVWDWWIDTLWKIWEIKKE